MRSYQNEIPKSRINIALEVDVSGAKKKINLPLKFLVLSNLSHRPNQKPLNQLEKIPINKANFEQALNTFSPTIALEVANKLSNTQERVSISLTFRSLSDFSPEKIVEQVPDLRKLLAMRNLLKDLKSQLVTNRALKDQINRKLSEILFQSMDK